MTTPQPPADPNNPTSGNPLSITTWVAIGGVIVATIIIITITQLNNGSGSGGAKPPPATASSGQTSAMAPTSAASAPDGIYRVIFDGEGSAHNDAPNNGQNFRSADDTVSWHLEYVLGGDYDAWPGAGNGAPNPSTEQIKGTGHSENWPNRHGACTASTASPASYKPGSIRGSMISGLKITAPIAGDLTMTSTAGCDTSQNAPIDPFFNAWSSSCQPNVETCQDLDAFWTATFAIAPVQTGTVVTQIPTRTFDHRAPNQGAGNLNAHHTWSGTITVIAQ